MKAFVVPLKLLMVVSMAATAIATDNASFQTDREREGSDNDTKIATSTTHKNKNTNDNAEEARWLVNTGKWGVLSYTESKENDNDNDNELERNRDNHNLRSAVISFADANNGSIFFYLMGKQSSSAITLTMSEASLEPTSNFEGAACGKDGTKDPEDPRCAKLSIQGSMAPCKDELTCQIGKKALFDRHPEMKHWPTDHDFTVHELDIKDVWMIANYGGGGTIPTNDYQAASPKHHPNKFYGTRNTIQDTIGKRKVAVAVPYEVPDWDKKVERSRWIVANSLWTTGTYFFPHFNRMKCCHNDN